jgi:hypothetical protein
MTTHPIIEFLQRDGALMTWCYERRVILSIEVLCLMAGVWAAPTQAAASLLLVSMPLALLAAEWARADRSGAARKAELAAARGITKIKLACERDLEHITKNKQLVTATAPIVALAMSVAGASGVGLTKAAITAFVVSVVRWTMVEAYGKWRAWYRSHVPVMIVTSESGA